MKDLEKIKSEDLGCQVQDANPGNFAIEQEVAQLVGATVPEPTEPSADDARELGAQLLVFLRRALLPIRSALRTAVAAIYAHLDSRCTDYTPAAYAPYKPLPSYDPMGTPPTPRTLPNLLTALTAFSARKISNGSAPNDGIKDGMSLARLLAADYSLVTKIHDDTHGWTMDKNLFGNFPNLVSLHLNCKTMTVQLGSIATLSSLEMPELELFDVYQGGMLSGEYQGTSADFRKLKTTYSGILYNAPYLTVNPFRDLETITPRYGYQSMCILGNTAIDTIELPNLKTVNASGGCGIIQGGSVRVIKCPALYSCTSNYNGHGDYSAGLIAGNLPNLEELWLGKLTGTGYITPNSSVMPSTPKLKKVVLGEGTSTSVTLNGWTPSAETIADADFLPNFKEFIALRLTSNGSGKTLTLSQAVFDTIWNQDGTPKSTDPDSVIYQINKIIKTDKHWSVNRA